MKIFLGHKLTVKRVFHNYGDYAYIPLSERFGVQVNRNARVYSSAISPIGAIEAGDVCEHYNTFTWTTGATAANTSTTTTWG